MTELRALPWRTALRCGSRFAARVAQRVYLQFSTGTTSTTSSWSPQRWLRRCGDLVAVIGGPESVAARSARESLGDLGL
jgi:uncharacterized protein CbrC (UPF0167 family)